MAPLLRPDSRDVREPLLTGIEGAHTSMARSAVWRELFGQLPDGLVIIGLDGALLEVNDAFCRLTGFERGELVGKLPPYPHWPAEGMGSILAARTVAMSGESRDFRLTFQKKTGERFPVSLHTAQLVGEDGRVQAHFATIKDLTEYDRLERQLRRSEERWRAVAETSYDYIAILDREYRFQYINRRTPTRGIDPSSLIGNATPFEFVEESSHASMRDMFERAFRDGTTSQFEQYVPVLDRWLFCRVGIIREGGLVTSISLMGYDITEKKRAEEALRANEQRLQLALAAGAMGAFDWDVGGGMSTLTPRLYEILGYEAFDPALDTTLEAFFDRVHPDDLPRVRAAVVDELRSVAPFDAQYRMRRATGDYVWVHCRARTSVDTDGRAHTTGVVTDISARVRAEEERQRLEAQVRQAQKMETLGTLAGGIAHDFNNLLTPVIGNAEMLMLTAGATNGSVRERLDDILLAANRAKDLVRRILVFARRGDRERRQGVRLQHVVREVIRLVTPSLPSNIEVITEIDDQAPEVWGLPGEMHQAVLNLCVNAHQALGPAGGHIKVGVQPVQVDETFAVRHDIRPGTAVRVSVQDDGPGFSPEVLERMFEPFFTTKPVGEGVGLGLSMVHAIMKRHEGVAVAEGAPGGGAGFLLYFPCDGASRMDAQKPKPVLAPAGTARILCVDDEPAVLRIVGILLQQGGYEVTLVSSANDALTRFRSDPDDYDLIVTDQTMPSISGLELAKRVHEIRPGLPVVLVTGYGEAQDEAGLPSGVRAIVRKPFTLDTLLSAVKQSLTR